MYENIAVANINRDVNGIELSFAEKPAFDVLKDLKENGFRWHNKKQIWYARNTAENVRNCAKYVDLSASDSSFGVTPEGNVDLGSFGGVSGAVRTDTKTARPRVAVKDESLPCIADFYDSVGGAGIYKDSTVEGSMWSSIGSQGYYADINAYIWCANDFARVIELDNAMKRGKECKVYTVSVPSYFDGTDVYCYLYNECGVKTPKALYELVRSGAELPGSGTLTVRKDKGVEVFSPFVGVKPLKELPKKWKKADLAKAIMAGQVYSGVLDYRYTDDYAYDAAYNFCSGCKLDLPGQACDIIEGTSNCRVYTSGVDENGIASVHFSTYSNESKTFLFDVNCDLAESIARQQKAVAELEAHNAKISGSVLKVNEADIDKSKVYVIGKVVEDHNTGKYSVEHDVIQGFDLVDRLGFEDITEYYEAELVPNKLYSVANFHNRREYADADARIVEMGNWGQICSGKAVEELTREGVPLKLNAPSYENPMSFEAAKKDLMGFISGQHSFMFGNKVDYSESLIKLETEEARIAKVQSVKKELSSLEDIIGFAEVKREFEKNQVGAFEVDKDARYERQ